MVSCGHVLNAEIAISSSGENPEVLWNILAERIDYETRGGAITLRVIQRRVQVKEEQNSDEEQRDGGTNVVSGAIKEERKGTGRADGNEDFRPHSGGRNNQTSRVSTGTGNKVVPVDDDAPKKKDKRTKENDGSYEEAKTKRRDNNNSAVEAKTHTSTIISTTTTHVEAGTKRDNNNRNGETRTQKSNVSTTHDGEARTQKSTTPTPTPAEKQEAKESTGSSVVSFAFEINTFAQRPGGGDQDQSHGDQASPCSPSDEEDDDIDIGLPKKRGRPKMRFHGIIDARELREKRKCNVKECGKHPLSVVTKPDIHGKPGFRCSRHGGGNRCTMKGCSLGAIGKALKDADAFGAPGYRCFRHGGGNRCTIHGCTQGASGKRVSVNDELGGPGYRCHRHNGGYRCGVEACDNGAISKVRSPDAHGAPGHRCSRHGGGRRCAVPTCTTGAVGKVGVTDIYGAPGNRCHRHGGR